MRTNLLCTFTNKKEFRKVIDLIVDKYDILYNKIFLLREAENDYNLMCTYNISVEENYSELENTILLHRKKQTNTLYTINALNALITVLNNGVLDTTYQLDWELYRNTMLLTNEEGLKRIDTEVEDIIYIKVKRWYLYHKAKFFRISLDKSKKILIFNNN